ncbi:PfkB family carbohydrate kinase [Streptomyces sp. NPDC047079]|uniref:PfkB family carbohydrate kinase n=1 Tax=Streptomyces sp. NPDC047079 TaxID=3154607 RepID=UPI003405637C
MDGHAFVDRTGVGSADACGTGAESGEHGDPPVEMMAAAVASHTRAPVVVTLGANGVLSCGADGVSTTRIPAGSARRVVDTTGAGDTFNGVFAASLEG